MNRILTWFLIALLFAMSGPLQAASMASRPGFRKSLYGRFAPWADKYAYCGGDPINASDPLGLNPENPGDSDFEPTTYLYGANSAEQQEIASEARKLPWKIYREARRQVANGIGYGVADQILGIVEGENASLDPDSPDYSPLPAYTPQTQPYWKQSQAQRHHVVQDAAARELPGYKYGAAPTVGLPGQAAVPGTPHNLATIVQQQRGGGTLAAEYRIAYKALRASGRFTPAGARAAVGEARAYFESLGHGPNTPTRIPANRTRP